MRFLEDFHFLIQQLCKASLFCLTSKMMSFEKINPDNVTLIFDDIENIESYSLIIDKKHIKDTYTINYEIRHITKKDGIYKKAPFCVN